MASRDICLVSGGDEIRLRSYVNHSIYAQLHGLDYRLECGIAEGIDNKFFYKTSAIRRVLPRYDWVVWIDDDCYVTDFEADNIRTLIERAEDEGRSLVIADGVLEPNGAWSTLNSGVMALKNCPAMFDLLDHMTTASLASAREWWDADERGIFTAGDQDLITWWAFGLGHDDDVLLVDHRQLNSRGHYYEKSLSDAFIVHFCGYPDKEWGAARFARRFGIGQELVPTELLDRFSVRVRSPMSPTKYWWRNRWIVFYAGVKARLRPHYRKWQARRAGPAS